MKKFGVVLLGLVMLFGFTSPVYAQNSDNGEAIKKQVEQGLQDGLAKGVKMVTDGTVQKVAKDVKGV